MNCKLYFILNKNGSISNEGTTPPKEVGEFVSSATLTISEWEQIRKDMRKIMTQFLKQLPHIRNPHPIGEGPTITIPRVEYEEMKRKIATLEQENIELQRENTKLRQQVVELQKDNTELRKTIEMQSKQIEMLVHRIEFLEARN
jgi:chromosome segregation ATPase